MPLSDNERYELDKELFSDFPGINTGQSSEELATVSVDRVVEGLQEPASAIGDKEPFPGYNAMIAEAKRRREAGEHYPHEHSDGMSHVSPRRYDRLVADQTESTDDSAPSTPLSKPKFGYRTTAQRNARAHEARARKLRWGK